ncbi:GntR family transcriptional regulator [Pararcticibacter amylolyticus]|uniref:HTH gntR-type domain-containing protein n=1 Tax=Pararcticibacter amylolyticus TaxID=2173175 RepID=A0A2U2PFM6_9SPHI|nr:GntR family transcriptional regulator [Pararcticibacter amylolyticus]PWG80196.1 hypothetical protein DDR33_13465 [Pararcticibacter amylolyticus]
MNWLNDILIDSASPVPKYLQLADAITVRVHAGRIRKNEVLPSLHNCCVELELSKKTVEKAYNTLKTRGIAGSFKGKGYYISG